MAVGKGFAKTILFGEHFVVYGLPGIAAGLRLCVEVTARKGTGIVFDDRVFNEKLVCEKNPEHVKCRVLKPAFEKLQVNNIEMKIEATSLPGVGMGYSASLSVAVIRALLKLKGMRWGDERVFELAFKCENVAHGNASGIDPACATFGGVILFEKNMQGGKNKIEKMLLGKSLRLVIASTGKMGNTKELVTTVRERKEKNPVEFAGIFAEYKALVPKAGEALKKGNLKEIGLLMNQNQRLLEKIGVSTPELENMCKLCMEKGALGSKLTGAGGGGCMIALCENKETQEKVFKVLKEKGHKTFKTMIGD